MGTIFRKGDRVRLTDDARAAGVAPGFELGTVCRSPNFGARNVKVVWDTHGSRDGLYCGRDLIQPAAETHGA
jgi:hypothetical protein